MNKYIIICALVLTTNTVFAHETNCSQENLFAPNIEAQQHLTNDFDKVSCSIHQKCKQLVQRMYEDRAATYNVLNLTPQQKKCKDDIEKRRYLEIDAKINVLEQELYVLEKLQCNPEVNKSAIKEQNKIIKNIKKDIDKIMTKYDKEFKCMLSGQQKSKYNLIQKMKRNDIKRCEKNKSLFKQDENLQPFGVPYVYDDNICPKHGKKHLFGRKCKLQK